MLDFISSVSPYMNVSGSESELLRHLQKRYSRYECKFDSCGSLFVIKRSKTESSVTDLIICPVDVDGVVCLYSSSRCSSLSATSRHLHLESLCGQTLYGASGNLTVPSKIQDSNDFVVKKKLPLGEVYRPNISFFKNKNVISGNFATRYALLFVMDQLIAKQYDHNVIFHFAVQGRTRAETESAAVKRIRPNRVLLLGAIVENKRSAVVLIRDGLGVSDPKTVLRLQEKNPRFHHVVCENAVTKMQSIQKSGVPCKKIALALPYTATEGIKERFFETSVSSLCRAADLVIKEFKEKE